MDASYNCIEQYIQTNKAESLQEDTIAQKILSVSDPAEQKALTRYLKDPQGIWTRVAQQVVRKAVLAKFTQNKDLQQYLLSTGVKDIAEASRDHDWGVGISLRNPQLMDKNLWVGKNWLGNILMSIRKDLQ